MSTTTEHVEHGHADDHVDAHSDHKPDSYYIKVALALGLITAGEVYASYADWLGGAFVPLLLIMMAIKFIMVVSLFMHLKFDNKIFSYLFYTGLILAILVYIAFLACFHFFSGN
ncbi:MAG: cytochrome C oxidase subunit IV family protein [Actinomycetota bacterium]